MTVWGSKLLPKIAWLAGNLADWLINWLIDSLIDWILGCELAYFFRICWSTTTSVVVMRSVLVGW